MTPVSTISGGAISWGAKNVDTDIIIPARWLKTVSREGLGKGAFESVRAKSQATISVAGRAANMRPGRCSTSASRQ
jgi:3-isopropylmalate dehydratase small subunit